MTSVQATRDVLSRVACAELIVGDYFWPSTGKCPRPTSE